MAAQALQEPLKTAHSGETAAERRRWPVVEIKYLISGVLGPIGSS